MVETETIIEAAAPETISVVTGKEYFAQWYRENGQDLNRNRKKRYQEDPEYKQKVLARNTETRKRKRAEVLATRRAKDAERDPHVNKSWKSTPISTVIEDGSVVIVQGFSIG